MVQEKGDRGKKETDPIKNVFRELAIETK